MEWLLSNSDNDKLDDPLTDEEEAVQNEEVQISF